VSERRGYDGVDLILARLEGVRRRHGRVLAAEAAAGVVTVAAGSLLVVGLVGFWPDQPPSALRWAMLIAAGAVWLAGLAWFALLPIRRRLNYAQTARLIEQQVDGMRNDLISALQLSDDPDQPSPALVQSAINETVHRTARARLARAVRLRSLRRWAISAGATAAALGVFALLFGPQLAKGISAVLDPTGYVRQIGSVELLSMAPGDATVFAGKDLRIVAKIANAERRRLPARVEIEGRQASPTVFTSADRTTFSCPLGKAEQTFRYAMVIGDSRFPADRPWYEVRVVQKISVEGLDLLYRFPPYIGRDEANVVNAAGPIEAPEGTVVRATVRLARAVPAAVLEMRSGQKRPMRGDLDRKSFTGEIDVSADDAYRIVLTDETGMGLQQLPDTSSASAPEAIAMEGFYPIRAVIDEPPRIEFVQPNRDVSVALGGECVTKLKASDDHGLTGMRLFLGVDGKAPRVEHTFADVAGVAAVEPEYIIEIDGRYREGQVLTYYATAADGRALGAKGGPQRVESARFKILVQDAAKVAQDKAERYEQLRKRLLELLRVQEGLRVDTNIAARKLTDLIRVRDAGGKLAVGQQKLRSEMLDVVDRFPFTPEMVTVQQALALLANNDALMAVTQARVLAGVAEMSERSRACATLAGTQDKIIRSLQTLLAILPSLAGGEKDKTPTAGEDVPPEAAEKLADLKADLEKFIDEQRKIIDASERLTKRPMDNFTAEDEKLLKDLELAQDKWEKFLNEKFADFSKLAQQDFSKPSLLKELISVKTDVTMAKDALQKKAVEIATAIEDNGIENAKTLTANIEKWLPDEPDRIKWDMEDPAGQSNIEQPELPKELEDLVGDLLEEEEDLFEEMDDITAKYAMSGDKGIGWDAMDGPISNMNAQGVTGNQLPNTSEISGRSGEGRQGKSLGEYVEDKAVGKGGRRTPTRLTPEPFQQGQVDDTSKEPAGGATGGGKLSGAGAEGLEGPLPPELRKELKRLAGRQGQLRNKAERVQAGFKATDFSNYEFLKAVTLMDRVGGDLENYRFANALRRRDVTLGALRRTQLLLAGKIDVTADATANMPKYVKDDIADSRQSELPEEYRQALKEYFTRLAETGGKKVQGGNSE